MKNGTLKNFLYGLVAILALGIKLHADPACYTLTTGSQADGYVRITYGNTDKNGYILPADFGNGIAPEYSYFTVDILDTPTPPIPAARYATWCFDSETDIDPGGPGFPGHAGTTFSAELYSSLDPNLNSHLPDHFNVKQPVETWNKLNWLINHRREACNGVVPTMWEVQRTIYLLFGQTPPLTGYPSFRPEVVQCLLDGANSHPDFQPGCGEKLAIVFNIVFNWDDLVPDVQLLFMEVPWCPPVKLVPGPLDTCFQTEAEALAAAQEATTNSTDCCSLTWTTSRSGDDCNAVITVKAENTCGKSDTVTYNVKIDSLPPQISDLQDLTVECGQALPWTTPTASDNCDQSPVVEIVSTVLNPDTCAPSYTRTWKATDSCGNSSFATQTITVVDNVPPVVTCPTDKQLSCADSTEPSVTGKATATDNCAAPDSIVITYTDSVTVDANGNTTIIRTWKAVDPCGNAGTCSQTIKVNAGGCEPGTFSFKGSSYTCGSPNVRTFVTANGVKVKVTAFSRTTSGSWAPAFVGQYSGGLGVTDSSEDGSAPNHTLDNVGRKNYLLFEFDQTVTPTGAVLGYVYNDSDMSIRIGTFNDPYNNHLNLNDSVFSSFGYAEDNDTTSGSPRTATFNAGKVSGNAMIIAASLSDSTADDYFKVLNLNICKPTCAPPPPVKASIGNRVWNDLNANGIQDAGEQGVDGVKVQLYRCSDNSLVETDITSGGGIYGFTVAPGDYYVKFSNLPSGYVFSPSTPGSSSDETDSDANPSNGITDCTTLTAGENDLTWDAGIYTPTPECVSTTFNFSGYSSGCGNAGNIRSFTVNGVKVNVSAFSRTSSGYWSKAYLGIYSGGLGVTDSSEGDGSNNRHTVDNLDRDNFILFEFSEPVELDRAYLGYVVGDSDLSIRIGTFNNPLDNHIVLNSTTFAQFGYSENNETTSSSPRWADLNSGKVKGNAIIIAASLTDSSPDDRFKIGALNVCAPANNPAPSPWCSKDIGSCKKTGCIDYYQSSRSYCVKGSGRDIWGTSDECRYTYQPANGDCTIVARVTSCGSSDPWAKAGVMIRETLNGNSEHASVFVTPGNGVAFQCRRGTGYDSTNTNWSGLKAPYWVKIVRRGNVFTGYCSSNGSTWNQMGSTTIYMGSSVYIGLGVTSHNEDALNSATFDNVSVTP